MIRNHVFTHSFMHFPPGLTHDVDLPDLLGCMVPKPLMVQYRSRNALYSLEGMEESAEKLTAIYSKPVPKTDFGENSTIGRTHPGKPERSPGTLPERRTEIGPAAA